MLPDRNQNKTIMDVEDESWREQQQQSISQFHEYFHFAS